MKSTPQPKRPDSKERGREIREASEIILGLIETYKRLVAKDSKELREHIVELMTDDQGVPRYNYFLVCRALHRLYAKRRIKMGLEKKSGLYVVSLR